MKPATERGQFNTFPVSIYWVTLLLCGLAFAPAILFAYGITDDYAYLWTSLNGSAKEIGNNFVWSVGRIPWALTHPYLFERVATVENLVWIRLASLLFVWATACLLIHSLKRSELDFIPIVWIVALLTFNPATSLIVSWTAAFNISVANFLSVCAGIAFFHLFKATHPKALKIATWIGFLLVLVFIVSIYQTSLAFFTLTVLILNWPGLKSRFRDLAPIVHAFVLFTLASAIYTYLYWFWITPQWGDPTYTEAARFGMDPGKLMLLFDQLIYFPLAGWFWKLGSFPSFLAFTAQAILILTALLVTVRETVRNRSPKLVALALVAATSIGSLSIISLQPVQALAGVYAYLALLSGLGLHHLTSLPKQTVFKNPFPKSIVLLILIPLPLLSAVLSWLTLIEPHQREYRYIKSAVTDATQDEIPKEIRILVSPMVHHNPTGSLRERFGVASFYSSSFGWAVDNIWNILLASKQPDWIQQRQQQSTRIEFTRSAQQSQLQEIDPFRHLEPHSAKTIEDPHFGPVQSLRDGWFFSEWFGYFQRIDDAWIYHPVIGYSAVMSRENGVLFIQTGQTVWVCIPEQFPFIIIDNEPYYLDISTNHWTGLFVIHLETGNGYPFPFN